MMMWRSLSGRTICQAADAVATRRDAKTKPAPADSTRPTTGSDGGNNVASLLPGAPATRGTDAT